LFEKKGQKTTIGCLSIFDQVSCGFLIFVYLSSLSIPLNVLWSSWYWLCSGGRCLDLSLRFRSYGLSPFWWFAHVYLHIYGPFFEGVKSRLRQVIWQQFHFGTCDLIWSPRGDLWFEISGHAEHNSQNDRCASKNVSPRTIRCWSFSRREKRDLRRPYFQKKKKGP
jgi:hypothetical protein